MRTNRKGGPPAVPLVILIAVLPLSSCGLFAKVLGASTDCERYVEKLDFATSDGILRGAWQGTVADLPTTGDASTLDLDLTASYLGSSRYEIEGSFVLEGEAPATITGAVSGGCAESYLGSADTAAGSFEGAALSPEAFPRPPPSTPKSTTTPGRGSGA